MSSIVTVKEKRRIQRTLLPMPITVEVMTGRNVTWNETGQSKDISAFGVGINLRRPVKRGRIVLLTIPMPRQMRYFDADEAEYRIWGLVRRCIETREGADDRHYAVGIAFVGKYPPDGFAEHPSRLYDISQTDTDANGFCRVIDAEIKDDHETQQKEKRKETRFEIPEELILELLDESGEVVAAETTVTENLSIGGAVVFTQYFADVGTFLRVSSKQRDVSIVAVVRSRRDRPDGMTRLHIEFIDRHFPLEGIV
jgi:hypothetical protein